MEHKIVYLLGAGASYGCGDPTNRKNDLITEVGQLPNANRTLPIVSEMKVWMEYAKGQLLEQICIRLHPSEFVSNFENLKPNFKEVIPILPTRIHVDKVIAQLEGEIANLFMQQEKFRDIWNSGNYSFPNPTSFNEPIEELRSKVKDVNLQRYQTDNERQVAIVLQITETLGMKESLINLFTIFDVVINQVDKHASIDTLARKYFLKKDYVSLNQLKYILCLCFDVWECDKDMDMRYDAFFAALGENEGDKVALDSRVSLVSWNYDRQLEKAANEYGIDLKANSKHNITSLTCQHVKMNGLASLFRLNDGDGSYQSILIDSSNSIDYARIKSWLEFENNEDSEGKFKSTHLGISFAWEKEAYATGEGFSINGENTASIALRLIQGATKLVVVGYTFPFYNREIDKQILSRFTGSEIVIQDPNAKEMVEKFKNSFPSIANAKNILNGSFKITPIEGTSQLYIPYDL